MASESITKDFLERILHRKVCSFKSSGGSNPGDNYTSVLISLEILLEGEDKPWHLLFKTFPHHPTRQKLLEDTNLFLKEFLVYDAWIPELVNLQTEILGNEKIFKPRLPQMVAGAAIDYENVQINKSADPILQNFILMVDERKTNGFEMADKTKSLEYDHVKIVLDELAKFHALGHAYKFHKELPSVRALFPFFTDPFFCNPNQKATMDAIVKMNLAMVRETVGNFLANNSNISESYKRFEKDGRGQELLSLYLNPDGMDEEEVENLMRIKPEPYARTAPLKDQWIVVGHGDCWTNNMLFKKDDPTGKVTDAMLVDLQLARESCLTADLIYFIYTSTDTEFRKRHLDEILSWYFEKFSEYCGTLKAPLFPGFTIENFKRKFHRSKIFGFIFAVIVSPIILCSPEASVDLDTLEVKEGGGGVEAEEIADMIHKSSSRGEDDKILLRNRFTALLKELYDEGVL